jgi:hypothetical protein
MRKNCRADIAAVNCYVGSAKLDTHDSTDRRFAMEWAEAIWMNMAACLVAYQESTERATRKGKK